VQKGFKVKQCFDPDHALEFTEQNSAKISAIILDIMMPPGKKYDGVNTRQGLITGLLLFDELRKRYPHMPIIVLTNVRNPVTLKKLGDKPLVEVAQKMEYPPLEFAELVEETIRKYKAKNYAAKQGC
jgi:CheY-like chemotaxis protein